MMRNRSHCSSNQGLTLIELMTVLIIIMLLAMVGFPTYQEYQNRANLAEAETTMGTMEKHLRTYFLDHGSFYSAAPTPATVPGLASLGDSSAFTSSGGWAAIGSPVANGAAVNFSYQAFAGQTPNGSTTPVVNAYLNDPTANMNLIRRTSTAYNYHFPQSAGIASSEEKLRLDWSDFSFCASASEYSDCIDVCKGDVDCENKCTEKDGAPAGGGKSAVENCQSACTAAGGKSDQCDTQCNEKSNGECDTKNVGDIDCYQDDKDTKEESPPASSNVDAFYQCADQCDATDLDCKGQCMNQQSPDCGTNCGTDQSCQQSCSDDYEEMKCTSMFSDPGAIHSCFDYATGGRRHVRQGNAGGGSDNGDGDAGGGSDNGDGAESGNEGGTANNSSAECASFGVSNAADFGIQANIPGHNWVVTTAVGNFSPGSECTLVAKVIQVIGGQMTQTDFIKINVGE